MELSIVSTGTEKCKYINLSYLTDFTLYILTVSFYRSVISLNCIVCGPLFAIRHNNIR